MIHLPWSYSSLGTFKKCPARYKFRYIERLPEGPKGLALQRGSDAHAELETFIKKGGEVPMLARSFDTELKELRVRPGVKAEERWDFDEKWRPVPDKSGSWCVMILDASYVEGPVGNLIDFKTGKIYMEEHIAQARLYAIGMLSREKKISKVNAAFWYIDKAVQYELEVTRAEVRKIANGYERQILDIDAEKKFTPNPTRLCAWCPYSKNAGGPCRAG